MTIEFGKIPCLMGLIMILGFVGCYEETSDFPVDSGKLSIVEVSTSNGSLTDELEGVKADAVFSIVFSSPVNQGLAAESTSLSNGSGDVDIDISFNENGSVMAITPRDSLAYETMHALEVVAGAIGVNGQRLETDFERVFTTEIEPNSNIFESGSGTEGDPFVIVNGEQMNSVRLFLESYFVLDADVDLSEVSNADPLGWEPVGALGDEFIGSFNGNGFTISGLTISRPDQTEVGLFGVLGSGGVIANVNVTATGVRGAQATGALVGRQLDGMISNCHSAGSITCTSSRAGGLVGSQEAGTILRCSSSCGISSELSRAGGLVGLTQAGVIRESFASGNCASMSSRSGGLVGSVEEDATIEDSYATGNTTGSNRVGSVFGRLNGIASRCYGTGSVTVIDADESGDYPGNVVGQLDPGATLVDAYYPFDQTINYGGGADITSDGSAIDISGLSCSDPTAIFLGFDFDAIWKCEADSSWPKLTWE